MFEGIMRFFKRLMKSEEQESNSKDTAKERLHLVLMQDRANVSADFLELMKQEIIDVIKKYIEVDESAIDVRLTNKGGEDGENGAPALYANIPILNIRNDMKKVNPETGKVDEEENKTNEKETKKKEEELKEKKQEEKNEEKEIKQEEEEKQAPKDKEPETKQTEDIAKDGNKEEQESLKESKKRKEEQQKETKNDKATAK